MAALHCYKSESNRSVLLRYQPLLKQLDLQAAYKREGCFQEVVRALGYEKGLL